MVKIRNEHVGEAAAIHAVHSVCFSGDGEAQLVDLLRAAGRLSVSLVAESDGAIVGHVGFSPVTVASGSTGAGLAPLAVLASHRRQGIGAMLVRAGLVACRDRGLGWVVVLGEPAYYSRFGFQSGPSWGLSDEYGGGDAFQAIELIEGALPTGAGLVRYSQEFASLG